MIIENFKFYTDEDDAKNYPDAYILIADFENGQVITNCGNFYYDYGINFEDFIKFAKYIEKELKK